MTLALNESRYNQFGSEMMDVLSSLASIEEGTCVIRVKENGVVKASPSAGTANDVFAGVAVSGARNLTQIGGFEEITIPASGPYTATLAHTPVGTVTGTFIPVADGALTIGAGAPSGTGVVQISGRTLTFHSADAGKKVRIHFKRDLSAVEAQALYGQIVGAGGLSDRTGVITKGELVFVSNYDPASDWWVAVGPVKCGANGNFTLGGSGAVCAGVSVAVAPTADFPFLGLNLR